MEAISSIRHSEGHDSSRQTEESQDWVGNVTLPPLKTLIAQILECCSIHVLVKILQDGREVRGKRKILLQQNLFTAKENNL